MVSLTDHLNMTTAFIMDKNNDNHLGFLVTNIKTATKLQSLTLKAPITTAADNIHKYFFHCFSEKIRLDFSSEFSARQRIHIKIKPYFLQKIKVKKLKCGLLQFLFGALRINHEGGLPAQE